MTEIGLKEAIALIIEGEIVLYKHYASYNTVKKITVGFNFHDVIHHNGSDVTGLPNNAAVFYKDE